MTGHNRADGRSPRSGQVLGGTEVPQRRRRPRYQVQVPVQIECAETGNSADALITDLSATGARIATTEWLCLPASFALTIRSGPGAAARSVQCIPRWQMSSAIGVKFERQIPDSLLQELIYRYGRLTPPAV